jgi:hypothetical protein
MTDQTNDDCDDDNVTNHHDDKDGPPDGIPTLRFRFAKTMQDTPHEYTVRTKENEAEYIKLFDRIGEDGWEKFKGRRYKYLYLGPFKYWRMTNDVRQSHVINRAKAEPVFGRERL